MTGHDRVVMPNNPRILAGADSTANVIKEWLVDTNKAPAGVLGVNDALEVITLKALELGMTQSEVATSIAEATRASASGVVVYGMTPEGIRPQFDRAQIGNIAKACEALSVALLDVLTFTSYVPKGWISARQQGIIS